MIEMAQLNAVHTLFTDLPTEPALAQLMRDQGVRCVVAQMGANTADAQDTL
jgi:hypothetical protein